MAGFTMCDACRREYEDPADRRFHAQPNACPDCGPAVRLLPEAEEPLAATVEALLDGAIVAVKGVGGFHLACFADHEGAVARLRARKHREDKPFALMVPDLASAQRLVELNDSAASLLLSGARPIVLAPRRVDAGVAAAVAPASAELGVMLPYSPLHHLLLADVGRAARDDERQRLGRADRVPRRRCRRAAQRHRGRLPAARPADRDAHRRLGRARVPGALAAVAAFARLRAGGDPTARRDPEPLLACGAELKNTFALAKGARAWVGHHIGDLENYETLRSFTAGISHFERLFAVEPAVVAHDLHPEYLSTKYAHDRDGVRLVGVQHHHAHLAACLAEHGETGPALGAIFDGTGYGGDGSIWGGEVLLGDLGGFERAGLLSPVRLPGGEAAIRQPWRMACSWLHEALGAAPVLPERLHGLVEPAAWEQVCGLVRTGLASPLTTSMGRLFDAVAALCGLRAQVNYEGQAAIELETCCDPGEHGAYTLPVAGVEAGPLVLDARATIAELARDLDSGAEPPAVAARFHNAVAAGTADACARLASRAGTDTVVLSGGVFQNVRLLGRTSALLGEAGLRVLTPELLPPNDGGIAYGQLAVAAARMR